MSGLRNGQQNDFGLVHLFPRLSCRKAGGSRSDAGRIPVEEAGVFLCRDVWAVTLFYKVLVFEA